jgi:Methane oxygenase PmoA
VMKFQAIPELRIVDLDITLKAREQVVLGDTKEGAFAIRLADALTEKSGSGKMVNDRGQQGMANVWGKRFSWVDYSGSIDGEKLGVAIFDNPSNPGYPSRWHARDYGLFALNPWGQHAFEPAIPEAHTLLDGGASLRFRWRVVIHQGDTASAHIAELYKEFVK